MHLVQANSTSNLRRYQELMGKKFKESEGAYYTVIDDLTQKLGDLDECGGGADVPDFMLKRFPFIYEWENGEISAAQALHRLKQMDPEEVAHKHLTRALTNYMFKDNRAAEYIKGILPDIKTNIVPTYKRYLELLTRYFQKMADEDAKQVPVSWLEVSIQKDDSFRTNLTDMPVNQVINYLDTYFLRDIVKNGYFFGNNVIVIDEDWPNAAGQRTTHWLFMPTAYAGLLKSLYDINNVLDLETDREYINGIIKEYAV